MPKKKTRKKTNFIEKKNRLFFTEFRKGTVIKRVPAKKEVVSPSHNGSELSYTQIIIIYAFRIRAHWVPASPPLSVLSPLSACA